MICKVCESKNISSTISVFYLDRKVGEFFSILGRKGAIEFCLGVENPRTKVVDDAKIPATIRTMYRCGDCKNERIVSSIYFDGTNFIKQ